MIAKGADRPPGYRDENFEICLFSATALYAIFDLFVRSFGYGHCVMSLSYSLYLAASIFLLRVQNSARIDMQGLSDLYRCMQALQQVSTVNTGMFWLTFR